LNEQNEVVLKTLIIPVSSQVKNWDTETGYPIPEHQGSVKNYLQAQCVSPCESHHLHGMHYLEFSEIYKRQKMNNIRKVS
jgi:hypothetical protein